MRVYASCCEPNICSTKVEQRNPEAHLRSEDCPFFSCSGAQRCLSETQTGKDYEEFKHNAVLRVLRQTTLKGVGLMTVTRLAMLGLLGLSTLAGAALVSGPAGAGDCKNPLACLPPTLPGECGPLNPNCDLEQ